MSDSYDEFALFHENAAEFGLPFFGPPVVRRERVEVGPRRSLSSLVWGDASPRLIFLHGGAQNAHTYDTVAMAIGLPLVCVDLPGHGHSDGAAPPDERSHDGPGDGMTPAGIARDVAAVCDELAPDAELMMGMSLGGLAAIMLADQRPDLVRRLVLVDITPGVNAEKAKAIADFVRGPATFPDFDALLARTMEHNPTRSESSLRRGILHNALKLGDGSWVWRHQRDEMHRDLSETAATSDARRSVDNASMWEVVGRLAMPVMLVRGMRQGSVVDDDDVAEFRRRCPHVEVLEVDAGHSVQGDRPLELADAVQRFMSASRAEDSGPV